MRLHHLAHIPHELGPAKSQNIFIDLATKIAQIWIK